VEQARFVVLKSLDIPSVLVETGFISNQFEERRLGNPGYQTRMAIALQRGIIRYLRHYPPPNTKIADHE
jgi:N-acetylmuramoyl-L-alanine amidase